MLNKANESIIKQEPEKMNKPNILVKIGLNKELTARDKKVYNILLRELLLLNLEQFKDNEIKISISKISQLLGVKYRNDLYTSLNNLMNTIIEFEERRLNNNIMFKTRAVMISSYTKPMEIDENMDYSSQNLTIAFDTRLTKKILQHANKYAKLDLMDINALKISHAITLYEIFIRGIGTYNFQKINYSEQELRTYLNLKNKYMDIRTFNQKVIKESINEINQKTKINVTYKRIKDKITKENIYKFEVNQAYRYNFKKFKKCIINNYKHIVFRYNKNLYTITKDVDEKDAKYLIVYAKTYKTITKEKAQEIWEYMYQILNKSAKEFAYKFITYNNLNEEYIEEETDENDIEEYLDFLEKYENII